LTDKPLISVIIPTKNSEATIKKCLESIKGQTYRNIEIIVVDNHSTDKTRKIALKYADKTLLQGGGMGVQVNKGVDAAEGEYIAYFDCDMYLSERVIEECLAKAEKGYDAIIIPEKCVENSFLAKCRNIEKGIYEGELDIEAARFYKKAAFKKVGGIDERLKGFRDYDVYQKVKMAGYHVVRISDSVITHDVSPNLKEILVKRALRAETFYTYFKNHPNHSKSILFRKALVVSFGKVILANPLHGIGLYLLKFFEYMASGLGLIGSFFFSIFSRFDNLREKHNRSLKNRSIKYAERRVEERKLWLIKNFAPQCSRILDLGCGNGVYIPSLEMKSDLVVGLDLNRKLCSITKNSNKNSSVICAEASSLPFRSGVFDVVWASEIIEHCPSWKVLCEVERVSRKAIFITIPNPYFRPYAYDPDHKLRYNWNILNVVLKSRRKGMWKYTIRGLGFYGIPIPKSFKLVSTILTHFIPLFSPCLAIVGRVEKESEL